MKNIIVPLDFSSESMKGLDTALLFANSKHTNIQMVYVLKKKSDLEKFSLIEEKSRVEKKLKSLIEKIQPTLAHDSKIRYIIKEGQIFSEILSQAKSYKDSLICMSTHGASGLEKFFMGSNAFKIIAASNIPVLTINKAQCPEKITKIILPIDSSFKTRQKVPFTAELAKLFDAEIHVLTITTSQGPRIRKKLETYTNQVCSYLHSLKLQINNDFKYGDDLADMVIDYADSVNAEMISIVTDTVSGVKFFAGKNTHEMINKANSLVMNFPPKILGNASSFSTSGG